MNRTVCAFTGHRPEKFPWGYNEIDQRCIALRVALAKQVKALTQRGVTDFLCGMAQGADLWFAAMVIGQRDGGDLPIKLHCILPYKGHANSWPEAYYKHYYRLTEQADSIVYVYQKPRKGCMLERNRFMVDHADTLLAVYNGTWRSGTGATLRYAQRLGRELIVMDPITLKVTQGNIDHLKEEES